MPENSLNFPKTISHLPSFLLTEDDRKKMCEIIQLQFDLNCHLKSEDQDYQPLALCMESLAEINLGYNALTKCKKFILNNGNLIRMDSANIDSNVSVNINVEEQAETLKFVLPGVGHGIKTIMDVLNSLMANLANIDILPLNYAERLIDFYSQFWGQAGGYCKIFDKDINIFF